MKTRKDYSELIKALMREKALLNDLHKKLKGGFPLNYKTVEYYIAQYRNESDLNRTLLNLMKDFGDVEICQIKLSKK